MDELFLPEYSESAGAVVGLGPESTEQFNHLMSTGAVALINGRVPFLMYSVNMPQDAETLILSGKLTGESLINGLENIYAKTIYSALSICAAARCTFAHVHCNTIGLVVEAFGIKSKFSGDMEVLTVADAISNEFQLLSKTGIKNIFPIGTGYTVNGIPELADRGFGSGMYDRAIQQANINFIKPSELEQHAVNQTIIECVQIGASIEAQTAIFESVLNARGILPNKDCVVLICCTDLYQHGENLRKKGYQVIDTTESVVKYTLNRIINSKIPRNSRVA